jgi:hypothetical protein
MFPDILAKLEQELRGAVAERRYGEVALLAAMFCDTAQKHAAAFPPGDPAAAQFAAAVAGVLEGARITLCIAREEIREQLRQVPIVGRYVGSPHPTAETVLLDL